MRETQAFLSRTLTEHARARMQQRGIRPEALEALLDFGSAKPAGGGREIVFFDKKARRRLGSGPESEKLRVPRFTDLTPNFAADAGRLFNTYAIVESDGKVITVGHRYRRIPRG